MKIYEMNLDHKNYSFCTVDDDKCKQIPGKEDLESWEMTIDFDGTKQGDLWWTRKMTRLCRDDGNFNPVGDYTTLIGSGVMILEEQAVKKLKKVLKNVEILPLDCDFGNYFAINILTVLDCLDYEKSSYETIDMEKPDGRPFIITVDEFSLKEKVIKGHKLFKIYDIAKGLMFVNEEFVEAVKSQGITGFQFNLVWESE